MIISRTPLRVSFVGGGTDLPSFYRQHGGAVVSMAIKKYVYLSIHEYFEREGYILKYSHLENPKSLGEIEHRIIKQVFTDYGITGVDFNSSADVPAGTGMGSSSAFTVGLINLVNAYAGKFVSRSKLADLACEVELVKLGEPIGKQDQYGCALGGINLIRFLPDETVVHEPIPLSFHQRRTLESNLLMFYLGGTRSASALLASQSTRSASDAAVIANLKAMAQQAEKLRISLLHDIDELGPYLHEGWERKRRLTDGISNPLIENAYATACANGATGGKLLGAGGSGFLLVYAPASRHADITTALSQFQPYSVLMDEQGAAIIYCD